MAYQCGQPAHGAQPQYNAYTPSSSSSPPSSQAGPESLSSTMSKMSISSPLMAQGMAQGRHSSSSWPTYGQAYQSYSLPARPSNRTILPTSQYSYGAAYRAVAQPPCQGYRTYSPASAGQSSESPSPTSQTFYTTDAPPVASPTSAGPSYATYKPYSSRASINRSCPPEITYPSPPATTVMAAQTASPLPPSHELLNMPASLRVGVPKMAQASPPTMRLAELIKSSVEPGGAGRTQPRPPASLALGWPPQSRAPVYTRAPDSSRAPSSQSRALEQPYQPYGQSMYRQPPYRQPTYGWPYAQQPYSQPNAQPAYPGAPAPYGGAPAASVPDSDAKKRSFLSSLSMGQKVGLGAIGGIAAGVLAAKGEEKLEEWGHEENVKMEKEIRKDLAGVENTIASAAESAPVAGIKTGGNYDSDSGVDISCDKDGMVLTNTYLDKNTYAGVIVEDTYVDNTNVDSSSSNQVHETDYVQRTYADAVEESESIHETETYEQTGIVKEATYEQTESIREETVYEETDVMEKTTYEEDTLGETYEENAVKDTQEENVEKADDGYICVGDYDGADYGEDDW